MSLETATYVNQLVSSNPVASDPMSQGDDHLRLVKSTLLNTFPNLAGSVTATQAQLNVLATMTYPLVAADLAANAVTTAKILDANVTTSKLAAQAVTTATLADANVTTAKIADANVTTSKLAAQAVVTAALADANVTYAKIQNVSHGTFLGRLGAGAGVVQECAIPFGQCRLSKSGGNLLLSPFQGVLLMINSLNEIIPDAGVTLAATGTAGVLQYIYAFMNAGVMTIEASTTATAVQAGTGVTIKSGDATRTLVGMARPIAGPLWADSATQRFVRSWFNDPGVAGNSGFTANRTTASTSWVELNTEIRVEFLSWASETVQVTANGTEQGGGTNFGASTSLAFDGTTAEDVGEAGIITAGGSTGNVVTPFAVSIFKQGLSEGYHYVTLLGAAVAGGTASFGGGANNNTPSLPRCTLRVYMQSA